MIPTGPNKMKMKLITEIAIHRGASARLEMRITMGTLTQKIPKKQQPCRSQRWIVMERKPMQSLSYRPGIARGK